MKQFLLLIKQVLKIRSFKEKFGKNPEKYFESRKMFITFKNLKSAELFEDIYNQEYNSYLNKIYSVFRWNNSNSINFKNDQAEEKRNLSIHQDDFNNNEDEDEVYLQANVFNIMNKKKKTYISNKNKTIVTSNY